LDTESVITPVKVRGSEDISVDVGRGPSDSEGIYKEKNNEQVKEINTTDFLNRLNLFKKINQSNKTSRK